jgi:hypothetical protein
MMKAILFLAAILMSFGVSCAVERSDTLQNAMGDTLCAAGWQLSMVGERSRSSAGRPASGTRIGSFRIGVDNVIPYCVGPDGAADRCQSCMLAMFSPFLAVVALFVGQFVWSIRSKPTALEHLKQLDQALALGALTREQYDNLRREVLADPEMTPARWREIRARVMDRPTST